MLLKNVRAKKQGSVCGDYCHSGKGCGNVAYATSNPSKIINVQQESKCETTNTSVWTIVGSTILTMQDRRVLESEEWLSDKHIHAAQQLLKKQHPQIAGLQDTILQVTGVFDVHGSREFVQCLNLGSSHWMVVSTLGCTSGVVRVYDSLHFSPSMSVKKTIARMIHTKEQAIKIEEMAVRMQKGGNDCGLFAIAMVTTLCSGDDPVLVHYEQSRMRQHVIRALEEKQLLPFPSKPARRKACVVRRRERVPVFCVCRLPDDGRLMVQCSRCKEWYHNNCVKLPETIIKNDNVPWFCESCK